MAYELVLMMHSWLRWAVVVFAIVALFRGLRGWLGRRDFTGADRQVLRLFVVACDVQLLLGLLLYFWLSPITPKSLAALKAGMKISSLRFYSVEHLATMLLVIVLAHLAAVSVRKAATPSGRHRRVTMFLGVIIVLAAVGIPWPWSTHARPAVRTMTTSG